MNVAIRKASPADVAIIAPLFDEYRIWYNQPSDLYAAEVFIRERLQREESIIFIAFADDKEIGFTQLFPIFTSVGMQRAWLLNDLFVRASARGKGAATALLNAAKSFAKAANSKWLMLETSNDNHAAKALYEKEGWKRGNDIFYIYQL